MVHVAKDYSIPRGLFFKIEAPGITVSRPALATTTAIYGSVTAPTRANHLNGLGRRTVKMKQVVLIIIEMK